jgi:hypothetical protein
VVFTKPPFLFISHLSSIYIYKSLGPRKKNPQQKKERAAETFLKTKLITKPLKILKMGAG